MALLVRTRQDIEEGTQDFEEWAKIAKGVQNNNRNIYDEIFPLQSGVERKKAFREAFGRARGDALRLEGGGIGNIGPATRAVMFGFVAKLARSLYYRHLEKVFSGAIYIRHYSLFQTPDVESLLRSLIAHAPRAIDIKRSGKFLHDQFNYRFNFEEDGSIFFAVVYFHEQLVFHSVAMDVATYTDFEKGPVERIERFGERFVVHENA